MLLPRVVLYTRSLVITTVMVKGSETSMGDLEGGFDCDPSLLLFDQPDLCPTILVSVVSLFRCEAHISCYTIFLGT